MPTELIIDIFKSFDIISSASALSQASRKMNTVWRTNIIPICHEVLPCGIEYYHQARQVWEEMKQSVLVVPSQSAAEDQADGGLLPARVLFPIAESVFSNIHTEFCHQGSFSSSCIERYLIASGSSSRSRFLRSYYRTMSILHLAAKNTCERDQNLSPLQLLDLFRMSEAMLRVLRISACEHWGPNHSFNFFHGFHYIKFIESDLEGISKDGRDFHHSSHQDAVIDDKKRLEVKIRIMTGSVLTSFLPLAFPERDLS